MKRVLFALRWTAVFTVLGFFSFISLANTFDTKADALSAHYNEMPPQLQKGKHYITIDARSSVFSKHKFICTLSQNQFDKAKNKFDAEVRQVYISKKGMVNMAKVPKSSHANHDKIFRTLGLHERDCIAIKQGHAFFFYLAPGVS